MPKANPAALFGAAVAMFCLSLCISSCAPIEREYERAPTPIMVIYPSPPSVQEAAPSQDTAAVHDQGVPPKKPAQCLGPGYYTCEDACPFAHGYMCPELATICGVTCGIGESLPDWDIEDPCAWAGFRLVITPLATGPECAPAQWIGSPCNEQFQAYCCSKDGSPLPASE